MRSSVSIHRRNTGRGIRYDVKLRRPDGTQYQKTFRTKKEAEQYEAMQVTAHAQGTWLDDRSSKVTFGEVAQKWLTSNPTKRQHTLDRDHGTLQRHILPTLGHIPIRNIRRTDIINLVQTWIAAKYAPTTIKRMKTTLSSVFNLAIAEEIIHKSPVHKIQTPRIDANDGRPLTGDEAQRLLEAIGEHFYALIFIMLTTGIRWSEAAGLEVRHFRPLSTPPTLSIEQGLHSIANGKVIEPTKSKASNRVIPLTQLQVETISTHLKMTGRTAADAGEPLFTSPTGNSLDYSNFRERHWKPAIEKAGLTGLTTKDIRKTASTNLVSAGVDLKTVTAIMGHEDIRTTLRHYTQATTANLVHAAQVLVEGVFVDQVRVGKSAKLGEARH